jgi:hypothetical protein
LPGDGLTRPFRSRALIVQEKDLIAVDRDEVLLIEDWRLRPDGTAMAFAKHQVGRQTIANGFCKSRVGFRACHHAS